MRPAAAAVVLVALAVPAVAHDVKWEAPEAERARANPVPASPEAVQKGRMLYGKHCESCHGRKGKGDGPAAEKGHEAPHDLTDAALQARLTDGEIFWKLTTGRKEGTHTVMPAFAREIPKDDDRWSVVHYVRTLGAQGAVAP